MFLCRLSSHILFWLLGGDSVDESRGATFSFEPPLLHTVGGGMRLGGMAPRGVLSRAPKGSLCFCPLESSSWDTGTVTLHHCSLKVSFHHHALCVLPLCHSRAPVRHCFHILSSVNMGTLSCIISPDVVLQHFPPSSFIPVKHKLVFLLVTASVDTPDSD